MKHTVHSRERLAERTDVHSGKLRAKLRKREFIGLPKQSLNKRVALVEVDGEPLVIVWSKSTEEIITLITLPMYLERHASEVRPRLLEKIKRQFPASFSEQAGTKRHIGLTLIWASNIMETPQRLGTLQR